MLKTRYLLKDNGFEAFRLQFQARKRDFVKSFSLEASSCSFSAVSLAYTFMIIVASEWRIQTCKVLTGMLLLYPSIWVPNNERILSDVLLSILLLNDSVYHEY